MVRFRLDISKWGINTHSNYYLPSNLYSVLLSETMNLLSVILSYFSK